MALNIPWAWLAVGEAVYLACAWPATLRENLVEMQRNRTPHPAGVMVGVMMVSVVAWPFYAGCQATLICRAIVRGWNKGK